MHKLLSTTVLLALTLVHPGVATGSEDSGPAGNSGVASAERDPAQEKLEKVTRTVGRTMTDSWILAKVRIALFADDRIAGAKLGVEVNRGVVTLRGKVDLDAAKSAAEAVVQELEGVKSVRNELQVVAAPVRKLVDAHDDFIVLTLRERISRDKLLSGSQIDVRSDAGIVTLLGDVPSITASALLSELAMSVPGVRFVKNALTIKSNQ